MEVWQNLNLTFLGLDCVNGHSESGVMHYILRLAAAAGQCNCICNYTCI